MTPSEITLRDADVPESLLRAVAAAERRQEAALNRLLVRLDASEKNTDPPGERQGRQP